MGYRIERKRTESYPPNPSRETLRRNANPTAEKWRPIKRQRSVITYDDADLAIGAVDHQVRDDEPARVVDHDTGDVVWSRDGG